MNQEQNYLLPKSVDLSNNIIVNNNNKTVSTHEGMNSSSRHNPPNNQQVQEKIFLPTTTTSSSFNEDDYETVPHQQHSLKEMGENEVSQFENMIQSLSPDRKQALIYSILQQQQQQSTQEQQKHVEIPSADQMMNESTIDNNSARTFSSSLDYNNNMMMTSGANMNSESIVNNYFNNSNVLMMNNNQGGDFQSITPIEELWFRSAMNPPPPSSSSIIYGNNNINSSPPNNNNTSWMLDESGKQQYVSCSLPSNYQSTSSGLSNNNNSKQQQEQYLPIINLQQNNEDDNQQYMMVGKSFPPSTNSSAIHLQMKLMHAYHHQNQRLQLQQQALNLQASSQLPHMSSQTASKNNSNVKANPEKGLFANEVSVAPGFDISPVQSNTITYQRGSSSSLLSQHLKASMSNNGTCFNNDPNEAESLTNNVQQTSTPSSSLVEKFFNPQLQPLQPQEEYQAKSRAFQPYQSHLPQSCNIIENSTGPAENTTMVTNLLQNHQLSSSPSSSFGHEYYARTKQHQQPLKNGVELNKSSTTFTPTCQPYGSSFSSFTPVTRPPTDAKANLSKSNSGPTNVPLPNNSKKETQPTSFFTSNNTIIGAISSPPTRAATSFNSPPSSSNNSAALIVVGESKKKNNNTSTSTKRIINSNTFSSSNVPSTNSTQLSSLIVGPNTITNNIQEPSQHTYQQREELYLYRNNQQEPEQSYHNTTTNPGNIQAFNIPQHAAVMNNNQLPNTNTISNSASYQQPSPTSSSQLQHQQNYILLQQHLHQSFPQNTLQQSSFVNGLPVVNYPLHQTSNHMAPPTFANQQSIRTSQESHQEKESDDEPYLPKQFSVLPPSSKRRMKRKTDQTTTIANVPSNTIASLNSTLLKKMTVDMYYDITSAGHPFLPREDLENLPVNDDQRTNLAFMFSLQTLCYQRFGLTKQAHDSFEKAKNLVMFNSSDPNLFNTACTYVNLALYCNSSGDPENAKKFSRLLDYNFLRDDSFRDSQNPEQLKALTQMKKISDMSGGSGYYGDERGLNDVSKFILSIYQYSTGGERPVPIEMMQIARQPLNMDTLPEYLSLLDCVMKMMLIYESKGLHFSDSQKKMTKYLYYGLSYGMKILLLKLCGFKGPELEEAAEKITLLCRTPTFTFAPTFLIQPVGLALDVHCEMLKEIDQGERSNVEEFKIAKLLRNDIESLRFLNSRYPELCANFSSALSLAESLLEKKGRSLSRFLDADIYSSSSGGVTIIEDELNAIEGQIKESAKLKRKSRDDEETANDDFNTPNTSSSTDMSSNLNMQPPPNSATFIPIISDEFPKNNYGFDPLAFLSEEDYELLFGEDQKSVNNDYY